MNFLVFQWLATELPLGGDTSLYHLLLRLFHAALILLRELRLPEFIQYYPDACEQAKQHHWDYAQFLAFLSEKELASRYARRVNSWLHEAKLPQGKTLLT